MLYKVAKVPYCSIDRWRAKNTATRKFEPAVRPWSAMLEAARRRGNMD
jgi:hypothetical protein